MDETLYPQLKPQLDFDATQATVPTSIRHLQCQRRQRLLNALAINSRTTLSELARKIQAPVSTVFDDLKVVAQTYSFVVHVTGPPLPSLPEGLPEGWRKSQERKRERHRRIINELKEDARAPLTELSMRLNIPISTLSDDMRLIRKQLLFTIRPIHTKQPEQINQETHSRVLSRVCR